MNALQRLSCLCGLALLMAFAMPTLAANGTHGQKLQDMVAQLNLTPDQQSKVDTIMSDMQQQVKDAHKMAKNGDTDGAHEKSKAARKDAIQKIQDVLTDDQKSKIHDLLKQAAAAHKAEKAGATTQPAAQ
jgi:uncharacterized iron-regulated membrane protein